MNKVKQYSLVVPKDKNNAELKCKMLKSHDVKMTAWCDLQSEDKI